MHFYSNTKLLLHEFKFQISAKLANQWYFQGVAVVPFGAHTVGSFGEGKNSYHGPKHILVSASETEFPQRYRVHNNRSRNPYHLFQKHDCTFSETNLDSTEKHLEQRLQCCIRVTFLRWRLLFCFQTKLADFLSMELQHICKIFPLFYCFFCVHNWKIVHLCFHEMKLRICLNMRLQRCRASRTSFYSFLTGWKVITSTNLSILRENLKKLNFGKCVPRERNWYPF